MIVYDKTGFVNVDNTFSATYYKSSKQLQFNYRGGSTSFTYECQEDAEKDVEELMDAYRNGYKAFQMKNSIEYKTSKIGKVTTNIQNLTE